MSNPPEPENAAVRSATLKPGVRRITLRGVPHKAGIAAEIFGEIGSRKIVVDDIIQGASERARSITVSFMVDTKYVDTARAAAEQIAQRYTRARVDVSDKLARLRVVGIGMRGHSGVAAKLFEALAAENINIENISTSEIVISTLIPERDGQRALQAVQKAFELDQEGE